MPLSPHMPPSLAPGDTVGIAAPASCFDTSLFQKGLDAVKDLGYKVRVPKQSFERTGYLAGSDQDRARGLMHLWTDPTIKAILCARGGYGTMRILPLLDFKLMAENRKILMGFSDISSLLDAVMTRCALPVFHGPVITAIGRYPSQVQSLASCLAGALPTVWAPRRPYILEPGKAAGLLAGGNLTTLCHLAGTPFQPDFNNKILFLEDVGEVPYRIDRMITHLGLCGMLRGVRGVVLGSFHDCGEGNELDPVVGDCLKALGVPVLGGFPAGHGRENQTFPLGLPVSLDTEKAALEFITP